MADPNVLNMRGTAAARPAAGIDGRTYWAYDTKAMSRDTGSTWETVTPAAGASGSILAIDGSGDLAFTPTLTQGDTFPVSPSDGDQHFRTDLGNGWVYNDSLGMWEGPEYVLFTRTPADLIAGVASPGTVAARGYIYPDIESYITKVIVATNPGATNDTDTYWCVSIDAVDGPTGGTINNLASFTTIDGMAPDTTGELTARRFALDDLSLAQFVLGSLGIHLVTVSVFAGDFAHHPTDPLDIAVTVFAKDLIAS